MDEDRGDIAQRYIEGTMRRLAMSRRAVEDMPQIAERTIRTVQRSRALLARLNGNDDGRAKDA